MNRSGGVLGSLLSDLEFQAGYWVPFLTYGISLLIAGTQTIITIMRIGIATFILPYETQSKALTDHVGDRKDLPDAFKADDASKPLMDDEQNASNDEVVAEVVVSQ